MNNNASGIGWPGMVKLAKKISDMTPLERILEGKIKYDTLDPVFQQAIGARHRTIPVEVAVKDPVSGSPVRYEQRSMNVGDSGIIGKRLAAPVFGLEKGRVIDKEVLKYIRKRNDIPSVYDYIGAPLVSNLISRSNDAKDSRVYSKSEIDDIFGDPPASADSHSFVSSGSGSKSVSTPKAYLHPEKPGYGASQQNSVPGPKAETANNSVNVEIGNKDKPYDPVVKVLREMVDEANGKKPDIDHDTTGHGHGGWHAYEDSSAKPAGSDAVKPLKDAVPAAEPKASTENSSAKPAAPDAVKPLENAVPAAEPKASTTMANAGASGGMGFKKWLPHVYAGAAGLGIGALIAYLMMRKKRRNKRGITKKAEGPWYTWIKLPAAAKGWAARKVVPELELADQAMTASTPKEYRKVNEGFRQLADDNIKEQRGKGYVPKSSNAFIWEAPFSYPGDNVKPVTIRDTPSYAVGPLSYGIDAAGANLQHVDSVPSWIKKDGFNPDPRAYPLSLLAAGMLPIGNSKADPLYKQEPNIGNMAYAMPALMGQWAGAKGLSKSDVGGISSNRLDMAVIDAVKHHLRQYPAARNIMSAYVNGGFGDSSQPEEFGIKRQLWDYGAKAPTPEGTNTIKKIVGDMKAFGAYDPRRYSADNPSYGDEAEEKSNAYADKHYNEILRFVDEIGPHAFMPKTILGKEMMFHPKGGIFPNLEKGWAQFVPYLKENPNMMEWLNGASGGMIDMARGDAVEQAAKINDGNAK